MAAPSSKAYQQHSAPAHSTPSYDSSSSASNPSPQRILPPAGLMNTGSSRPGGGPNIQPPPQLQMPPAPMSGSAGYAHSWGSASASPRSGPPGLHDTISSAGIPPPGIPPPHMSAAGLQAQKRAYRQRRKDPSCDACRERKVKCDATDTTSCSECTSRNVKCQFTKETNRRMSSIKQVQDLEKQLVQARQQLNSLRSLSKEGSMDIDAEISHQSTLNLPDIGSHPHRHPRPPPSHDLSRVRANLRNIGRGVFKPPPPYRQLGPQPSFSPPRPALLPRGQAEHILDQYYSNVHTVIPILHWPTFCKEVDEVYKAGTLHGFPPIWGSLFFSVLACGTIHTTSPSNKKLDEGKEYIEAAQRMVDFYDDEFAVNNVRQALLTSVFLCEMNLKSAAWVWLGASIRMAQDIGLHCDTGPWPAIENEMRKRVWWGIYVWDRLLSLELGRPLQIDDDDCDVGLPCPVDDRFIHDSGILAPSGASQPGNFLLSTIHVVRSIGQLKKTLKAPVLTSQTLHTFETHFAACMATFPPSCQPNSPDYLDPRYLSPVFYLQNVRLALHRHNLSTSSLPEARSTALDHCVATARDTFRFLSRAMSSPQSSPNSQERQRPWEDRLAAAATTLLCAHIWRCTLFLCFRAYYTEALACIRASAAIGDNRAVNVACGRNLASFLRVLVARLQRGEGNNLDRDEEMMAYVSGDVQASAESSWVWHGSETGMTLNNIEKSSSLFQSSGARSEGASHMPSLTVLTPEEANDWGGWEKQKWLLETLLREQRGASGHVRSSPDSSPPSVMPPPQPSAQSLSRISIANII